MIKGKKNIKLKSVHCASINGICDSHFHILQLQDPARSEVYQGLLILADKVFHPSPPLAITLAV